MLSLLEWCRSNQSELLSNPARRGDIAFETDILANEAVHLAIKLPVDRTRGSNCGKRQRRRHHPCARTRDRAHLDGLTALENWAAPLLTHPQPVTAARWHARSKWD
ncbi:hypothetical protein FHR50_002583 [Xanthomonas arboricola]